ncbi:MAG: VTT domain-containing protein, partial [Casimicrobiaceae bacterium]
MIVDERKDRTEAAVQAKTPLWPKLLVGVLFTAGLVAFFVLDGPKYLNLETIKAHRDDLLQFTREHYVTSLVIAFLVYVLTVTFSLPGAALLSLTMGLLFGRWIGTVVTVTAATVGATLLFLGARYLFADFARRRLGGWYEKMRTGFAANAFSYLLFLRLVPVFPFFLVNLAPAVADIPLRTYVIATAIGIVPGSFVYVNLGETLGRIDSTRDLVSPATLIALALLGVVAL